MALQKTIIPLLVDGGIDTKTDNKLVPDSKVLESENVDYTKVGAIKKSKGLVQLTDSTGGGLQISGNLSTTVSQLITHNNELIAKPKTGRVEFYSYSEQQGSWRGKNGNNLEEATTSVNYEVDSNAADYTYCLVSSVAYSPLTGVKVVALVEYISSAEKIGRICFIDENTGQEESIVFPTANGEVTDVKVLVLDHATSPKYILMYTKIDSSAGNSYLYFVASDFYEIGSLNRIADYTGTTFVPAFDMIKLDEEKVFIAYYSFSSQSTITASLYDKSSGITHTVNQSMGTNLQWGTTSDKFDNVNLSVSFYGNYVFAAAITSNNVNSTNTPAARNLLMARFAKADLTGGSVQNILSGGGYTECWQRIGISGSPFNANEIFLAATTLKRTSAFSSGTDYRLYLETKFFEFSFVNSRYTDLTTSTTNDILTNTQLISCPFQLDTSSFSFYFVVATTTAESQTETYYLIKLRVKASDNYLLSIAGKFLPGLSYNLMTSNTFYFGTQRSVHQTSKFNDNSFLLGLITKSELITASNATDPIFTPKATTIKLGIEEESSETFAQLGQSTMISGSMPIEFDGANFHPAGFLSVPNLLVGEASTSGKTPLPVGLYQYKAVLKYYDANGEVHYSAESNLEAYNATGSSVAEVVIINKNELLPNKIKDARSFIELYRTTVNTGDPFYLVFTFNSTEASFSDVITDATISANKQLYTSGGVVQNNIVPPMSYITSGIDRMFGVSIEDKNKIYYSQKRIVENAIEWNEGLSFRVDGNGKSDGEAIGVEVLDDKIIILKTGSVLYVQGDGPSPNGLQDDFTSPSVITTQVGCTEKQSIVLTPNGVMFKGKKGIYIVDRGLSVTYIGAAVEEFNDDVINATGVSRTTNEVYFQQDDRCLIYDYLQNKWSVNTYLKGKSLVIWGDSVAVLKSDSRVYYQSDLYTDNSSYYSMKVTTSWYKMTGLTGYGRLYEVAVLGKYKSDHTLNVRVYYDYDDTDYDDYSFAVTNTNIYEYQVKPSKQKCQAFKIQIWDSNQSGTGESLELTGISVRVGAKKGLFKLSDNYRS